MLLIDRGRTVAFDTPKALKSLLPATEKIILGRGVSLEGMESIGQIHHVAGESVIYVQSRDAAREVLTTALRQGQSLSVQPVTLEDAYVHLLSDSKRGGGA